MRLLVFPRDPNPYQGLLYSEMQRLGVRVSYIGGLTPSHTLNLLLLPLEVAARRMSGARLIHLHWVYAFGFPGGRRVKVIRRMAYVWFLVWLRTCRVLGLHLVWTAHNVLPHGRVFPDEASARRALVKASDLVVAHSQSTLTELATLGATARRSAVIPHGPVTLKPVITPQATCGTGGEPCRFLFFGRVEGYKGVDDLVEAFAAVPDDLAAHLTVAGQCDDPSLRSRLRELARRSGARVVLRLERIPEQDLAELLADADAVVLPFRKVTTSSSAMLALSHGRPLIVPDLPALADLPDQAVLRYDGKAKALTAALTGLARADVETLAAMSRAARDYAFRATWEEIAARTRTEMLSVLGTAPGADCGRPARAV